MAENNISEFEKETEEYFYKFGEEIKRNYDIAEVARSKGLDPKDKVEVPLALTMAAKVVRLISTIYPQLDNDNIINRILELEKEYGALDSSVSFRIAEEIYFIYKNLGIQVCGDPTESKEVSNHKDLRRIETNFIRGGLCLILGEGMAQKAKKGLRILKLLQKRGFDIHDWEWLDSYVELQLNLSYKPDLHQH